MKADGFRDQVAIVTGGSAGIGQALALQLARQGAKVVLAARRAELLEQVAVKCRLQGGEVLVVPTDVSDQAQCKALVEQTIATFGRLDILVNNAGLAAVALICPFWVATEFHTAQLNKDGEPRGVAHGRDMYTAKTMTAERCAEIALRAAYKRRREVLMGPGFIATWLKVLAPGLLDWLVIKVFLEPVIRRARAARR